MAEDVVQAVIPPADKEESKEVESKEVEEKPSEEQVKKAVLDLKNEVVKVLVSGVTSSVCSLKSDPEEQTKCWENLVIGVVNEAYSDVKDLVDKMKKEAGEDGLKKVVEIIDSIKEALVSELQGENNEEKEQEEAKEVSEEKQEEVLKGKKVEVEEGGEPTK